jgi:hypothetical protein
VLEVELVVDDVVEPDFPPLPLGVPVPVDVESSPPQACMVA